MGKIDFTNPQTILHNFKKYLDDWAFMKYYIGPNFLSLSSENLMELKAIAYWITFNNEGSTNVTIPGTKIYDVIYKGLKIPAYDRSREEVINTMIQYFGTKKGMDFIAWEWMHYFKEDQIHNSLPALEIIDFEKIKSRRKELFVGRGNSEYVLDSHVKATNIPVPRENFDTILYHRLMDWVLSPQGFAYLSSVYDSP